jgi:hypothetical protein
MEQLFELIQRIADKEADGHYTIMAFTTNFRGCYGTPGAVEIYEEINKLPVHDNLHCLLEDMIVNYEKYLLHGKKSKVRNLTQEIDQAITRVNSEGRIV